MLMHKLNALTVVLAPFLDQHVTPDKDTIIVEDILPTILLATPTVTAVDGGVGEDAVALCTIGKVTMPIHEH